MLVHTGTVVTASSVRMAAIRMTVTAVTVTAVTITSTVVGVVSFVLILCLFQRVERRVEVVMSNAAFSLTVVLGLVRLNGNSVVHLDRHVLRYFLEVLDVLNWCVRHRHGLHRKGLESGFEVIYVRSERFEGVMGAFLRRFCAFSGLFGFRAIFEKFPGNFIPISILLIPMGAWPIAACIGCIPCIICGIPCAICGAICHPGGAAMTG